MTVPSYLGRYQARTPTTAEDLKAMRRSAWLKQGIAVLDPNAIKDEWLRQAVINEANRLFGRREGRA